MMYLNTALRENKMKYGFRSRHTETTALGLQLCFTRLGGCELVNNRLKINTAD